VLGLFAFSVALATGAGFGGDPSRV